MPIPSSAPSQCAFIAFTTVADAYYYPVYVQSIRWDLTTAATSTWALQVLQSTAVYPNSGSTYGWPLIGTSTAPIYVGGYSTVGNFGLRSMDFPINNWCYGIVVTTIGGGVLTVVKGVPGGAAKYSS